MEDKFKISNKIKFYELNKNVVIVVHLKISMRPSVTTTAYSSSTFHMNFQHFLDFLHFIHIFPLA